MPNEFTQHILSNPDCLFNINTPKNLIMVLDRLKVVSIPNHYKVITESKNIRQENIFHNLATKGWIQLADHLIELMEPTDAARLLTERRMAGKGQTPLMLFICKSNQHIVINRDDVLIGHGNLQGLLTEYEKVTSKEDLVKYFKVWLDKLRSTEYEKDIISLEPDQKTILHLCGDSEQYDLFLEICKFIDSVDPEKLIPVMNSEQTPLTTIKNQEFLKEIVDQYLNFKELSCRKIMLWHCCNHNFNEIFHLIKESMCHKDFMEMIKECDTDGNNASMIAASKGAGNVLMSLLGIITYGSHDKELIDEYLHNKNKRGQTILKLVISQDAPMSLHRDFLIKAEKDFHCNVEGGTGLDLGSVVECFNKNIGPHFSIEKAINEERKLARIGYTNRAMPYISAFVGFLFAFSKYTIDVGTDVYLVNGYYADYNQTGVFYDEALKVPSNSTCPNPFDEITEYKTCSLNVTILNKFACLPWEDDLPAIRFNYSLAFILFPFISYMFEWYYSNKNGLQKRVFIKHYLPQHNINKNWLCILQIGKLQDWGLYSILTSPIWVPLLALYYLIQIILWPYLRMVATFLIKKEYNRKTGSHKIDLYDKLQANELAEERALLFEASLESSFQVSHLQKRGQICILKV